MEDKKIEKESTKQSNNNNNPDMMSNNNISIFGDHLQHQHNQQQQQTVGIFDMPQIPFPCEQGYGLDYTKSTNNINNSIFGCMDILGTTHQDYYTLYDLQSLTHYGDPLVSSTVHGQQQQSSLRGPSQQGGGSDPSPSSSTHPGESSEVVNTPNTPTSLDISSSSSEAANDEHPPQQQESSKAKVEAEDDVEDQQHKEHDDDKSKNKSSLKVKKKKQKKVKEPRFAFMTKSEVDHLDDGYRWRKYGQKAVKNSPFPRSYYRCTTASCGVKKRVERSCDDPSIVVTTYEGQHMHPCPVMTRGGLALSGLGMGAGYGHPPSSLDQCSTANTGGAASFSLLRPSYHQYHPAQFSSYFLNSSQPSLSFASSSGGGNVEQQLSNTVTQNIQQRQLDVPSSVSMQHQVRDDGLLQDIVPSQMRNEVTKEE